MSDKLNKIFGAGEHPSDEELLAYVNGKASEELQHRIEKHILDCEMCSDALEGLRSAQSRPGKVEEDIRRIRENIPPQKKESGSGIRFFLYAAAMVLVISLSWFLYNRIKEPAPANEQIAQKKEPVKGTQPGSEKGKIKDRIQENDDEGNEKNSGVNDNKDQEEQARKKSLKEEQGNPSEKKEKDQKPIVSEVVEKESTEDPSGESSLGDLEDERSDQGTKANKDVAPSPRTQSEKSAAPTINQVEEKAPRTRLDTSYLEEALEKEQFDLVLDRTRQVLEKDPDHETALWYRALSLIGSSRDKEARETLKKLVNIDGTYKERAQRKLEEQ